MQPTANSSVHHVEAIPASTRPGAPCKGMGPCWLDTGEAQDGTGCRSAQCESGKTLIRWPHPGGGPSCQAQGTIVSTRVFLTQSLEWWLQNTRLGAWLSDTQVLLARDCEAPWGVMCHWAYPSSELPFLRQQKVTSFLPLAMEPSMGEESSHDHILLIHSAQVKLTSFRQPCLCVPSKDTSGGAERTDTPWLAAGITCLSPGGWGDTGMPGQPAGSQSPACPSTLPTCIATPQAHALCQSLHPDTQMIPESTRGLSETCQFRENSTPPQPRYFFNRRRE